MAHWVWFILLFAELLIGGFSTQKLPPSNDGKLLSILSIDGGGIKGILPARVLEHLDKALKDLDPNADLAHYFDVIAGTSTGGLITVMLATPSPHDPTRAAFTPAQIVDFYQQEGPHIFNESCPGDGPEFDGVYFHNLTRDLLNDTRLNQTLTNVVIPAFDIKTQKPVIFSNYKLEDAPYLNALLSDITISTSAAPTILPPYCFVNDGVEFNMADGGIAAGNPTQAAVSEVLQQHGEYSEILVLSLGTGKVKVNESFDVEIAANWSYKDWVNNASQFFLRSSTTMTEYYLESLFEPYPPGQPYLRIQEYDLNPDFSNPFNVTQASMDGLDETGKQLLKKKALRMNLDTFDQEELGGLTNAQVLDRFAEILYGERQYRLKRKSMEKEGRPFVETLRVLSDKTQALIRNLFN
ncbi:patatin-2-Kuras 4-like [Vigna unguiculata]|uniref:patatin-2-Kuras 4-like n=1 Tax=Vigna unguiculata TaxID=3917 RepID=UPI00101655E2|nr:patatin-2-Kuras 4-like [Vigna unguiculata]